MPVAATVALAMVGFCWLLVNPLGPVQLKPVIPAPPAVRLMVPVLQIVLPDVADAVRLAIASLTNTDRLLVWLPQAFVAVRV